MGEVDVHNLKFWCDKVVRDPDLLAEDSSGHKLGTKDFKPPIKKTFCNVGLNRICVQLGYTKFQDKMANDIYDYCAVNWTKCTSQDAVQAACLGDLVVSAWRNPEKDQHGHVALVYPDSTMLFSGKWSEYCPKVANIGKTCGIEGANWAFEHKPDYFRAMKVTF